MDKEIFLAKLADVLEVNRGELDEQFELNANNWDSVAHLATIAVIDELYGATVPGNELIKCRTVGAVLELVEQNVS
jgi:acyl carrier protein